MSLRTLMFAAVVVALPAAAWAAGLTPEPAPFSYDLLHPGGDLQPQFVDPNGMPPLAGPLDAPPALTPHQDCIPYHQQMTRDSVYPYSSGPCLPGDQR